MLTSLFETGLSSVSPFHQLVLASSSAFEARRVEGGGPLCCGLPSVLSCVLQVEENVLITY